VKLAKAAIARIQLKPWHPHVLEAMEATARLRAVIDPFIEQYASEIEGDVLPTLWRT
jgi:hypothetical protein